MNVRCRKLGEESTEREVEVDDPAMAADEYAMRFVKMEAGDVVFVECREGERWVPWRVTAIGNPLPLGPAVAYFAEEVTAENAREEIALAMEEA